MLPTLVIPILAVGEIYYWPTLEILPRLGFAVKFKLGDIFCWPTLHALTHVTVETFEDITCWPTLQALSHGFVEIRH